MLAVNRNCLSINKAKWCLDFACISISGIQLKLPRLRAQGTGLSSCLRRLRLIFATVFACQLDAKKLKMLAWSVREGGAGGWLEWACPISYYDERHSKVCKWAAWQLRFCLNGNSLCEATQGTRGGRRRVKLAPWWNNYEKIPWTSCQRQANSRHNILYEYLLVVTWYLK